MIFKKFWLFVCIFLNVTPDIHNYSFNRKCPNLQVANARIRYRQRGRVAKIRCNSGFISVGGERRLTCLRGNWLGTPPTCIASGCKEISFSKGEALSLYSGAMVHLSCMPGYALEGSSALYCNGENWNASEPICSIPPSDAIHFSCTFESPDLCHWKQDHLDSYDWKWGAAALYNHLTTTDHTFSTSKGHFMVAEFDSSWTEGQTARFFSPIIPFPEETPGCVTLWYLIKRGSLRVYVRPETSPFEIILPQTEYISTNSDDWSLSYVYLQENDDEHFQIVIEAIGEDGYVDDIAVDDFLVSSGQDCIDLEIAYEMQRRKSAGISSSISATSMTARSTSPVTQTSDRTCWGSCGKDTEEGGCRCDHLCVNHNQCCSDYITQCLAATGVTASEFPERSELTEPFSPYSKVSLNSSVNSTTHIPNYKTITEIKTPIQAVTTPNPETTTPEVSPAIFDNNTRFGGSQKSSESIAVTPETSSSRLTAPTPSTVRSLYNASLNSHTTLFADKLNETLTNTLQSRVKRSGWFVSLMIATVCIMAVGILVFWWHRRKRNISLCEDSDIRRLKEEAKEEEELHVGGDDDNDSYTGSYKPLENSTYPQEDEGTPV